MIFDIKMYGNFTDKCCLVDNGRKTDTPASITYSSVVSRDIIRIDFLIASWNDLDICACDIRNAYLNAKCRHKIWMVVGTKFDQLDRGSVMIIYWASYRLKSSGSVWRAKLANTLNHMGNRSTESDPYVWFKWDMKPSG